jgi:hypothetical protein
MVRFQFSPVAFSDAFHKTLMFFRWEFLPGQWSALSRSLQAAEYRFT